MKTKTTIIFITLLITSFLNAQQIGNGYAPYITDWTQPLLSGVYGGPNAIGAAPDNSNEWQHLLVIRHGNPENNNQLQIASSFGSNDKLFFRKLSAGLTAHNPNWIELATRGANSFNGNQIIMEGNLGIGTNSPSFYQHGGNNKVLEINNANTSINSQSHIVLSSGSTFPNTSLGTISWAMPNSSSPYKGLAYIAVITGANSTAENPSSSIVFATKEGANSLWKNNMILSDTGNLGIGTTNPTSKLTVAGNIASREVKVTVDAGADFVFENNYNLPSLDSVNKFIAENKHLPQIASAEEMKKDGINLSEMNIKLLQKIEELTLYMIEMKKENESLKYNQKTLENRINKIESK